jgi:8-oxo-dGTP pyrophosphatase MutT (NUDIX family)
MDRADAAVAILHARKPYDSVLLIRRSEREDDPWSGHWSFPGGRYDPADADALATALRELREECGIELDRSAMERRLDPVPAMKREGRGLRVAPFVFGVDRELDATLDAREAAGCAWVPLETLRDPASHRVGCVPRLPEQLLFPYIAMDTDGMPLWGFTYRLITNWLELTPWGLSSRGAAFDTARRVLDIVLRSGAVLKSDWQAAANGHVATVAGAIPTAEIASFVAGPNSGVPLVNSIEIGATRIQVLGLALETYVISAEPA